VADSPSHNRFEQRRINRRVAGFEHAGFEHAGSRTGADRRPGSHGPGWLPVRVLVLSSSRALTRGEGNRAFGTCDRGGWLTCDAGRSGSDHVVRFSRVRFAGRLCRPSRLRRSQKRLARFRRGGGRENGYGKRPRKQVFGGSLPRFEKQPTFAGQKPTCAPKRFSGLRQPTLCCRTGHPELLGRLANGHLVNATSRWWAAVASSVQGAPPTAAHASGQRARVLWILARCEEPLPE
jgi:hypothetical protein